MIRTLFRHIIDSFKDLKRNGWMTIASVTSVTITLLMLATFTTFILNINQFAKDVQKNVTVSVFVATEATKKEQKELRTELEKIPNVDKIKYSSKENEYKKFIAQNKEWKGLFTEKDNPLYSVFMLSAKNPRNMKEIQKAAKGLPHVIYATYGGENSEKILKLSDKIKLFGFIAGVILLIISILLVSNTIKLTIIARSEEIKIMRLVGATNGYIRWPFILEGIWVGIIGSIIPLLTIKFGYSYLYKELQIQMMQAHYNLLSPHMIMESMTIFIVGVGVIIGALGSFMSMRKFLKI